MFRKPIPPLTVNEKIIASVLSNFQYTAHFNANTQMTEERKSELFSPDKTKEQTASSGELGYLKVQIAEEFIKNVNQLKKNKNLKPEDLIKKIEVLIANSEKDSNNIRNYKEVGWTQGGWSYVHDLEQEYTPSSSYIKDEKSHDKSRLEKNFKKVSKVLTEIKSNYGIESDIYYQMEKIKTDGKYDSKKKTWGDSTSRYPQKYVVLEAVQKYLDPAQDFDLKALSDVVHANDKYDKGGIGRTETGKILDRALELKGEKLIPPSHRHTK